MRLFTHNLVVCNVKACVETSQRDSESGPKNFPLKIEPAEDGLQFQPSEFSSESVLRILPKLDWTALKKTAADLNIAQLPPNPPPNPESDPAFLKSVHDLVMDTHIMEGELICPNCSRAYPVKKGIANMLLREDEL